MILDLIKNNASYDIIHGKPSHLEKRGNKTLVRINIKDVLDENEKGEIVKTGYSCFEIAINKEPTKDNIKRAIMNSIYPHSEAELINNYQSYKMGISSNKKHELEYIEYLNALKELDELISLCYE